MRRRNLAPWHLCAGVAAATMLLASCSSSAPESTAAQQEPEPTQQTMNFSIENVDFGNLDWIFIPHTQTYPPILVTLSDGTAENEGVQYTVVSNEVVYSDADGDGDLDALVPIEAYAGGNSVDRQWYIWADEGGEPKQVEWPVARTIHCGTVTQDVSASASGFEVHEFRHNIGEEHLACTDLGSDERIRTVGISEPGEYGARWPVQIAPFPAFGGICPVSVEYHAYPTTAEIFAVPDSGASPLEPIGETPLLEWQVESWSIYTQSYPGWGLIGLNNNGNQACAWVKS